MREELFDKNIQEILAENERLKTEIAKLTGRQARIRNARLFILNRIGSFVFLGPRLKKSLVKVFDGDVSKESIADLVIAAFYRLTRIGWITLLIAIFPIGITGIQAMLFHRQNIKIENQNRLIAQQTKRLNQQTYLIDAEMKMPAKSDVSDLIKKIDLYLSKNDSLDIVAISDISSTLFRFKPYKFINEETDELTPLPYSPEKSSILLHLIISELNTDIRSKSSG